MIETPLQPLTTYEVSRFLKVDLTTVINWCDQGKLKAYKTPGGHRRVDPKDFLYFLKEYRMPVPGEFEREMQGGLRIVIVDDEKEIRRVVVKALQKHLPQAKFFEARDGFEAGMLILDQVPGLVILDLMLPGVDGFKVCANIRSDARFRNTKVLAITGQNTDQNKSRILEAGADDFLAKPFDVKALMEKVSKLLKLKEPVR